MAQAAKLSGKATRRAQNYVCALADSGLPFEFAVFYVARWLRDRGFELSEQNMEIAFDI